MTEIEYQIKIVIKIQIHIQPKFHVIELHIIYIKGL